MFVKNASICRNVFDTMHINQSVLSILVFSDLGTSDDSSLSDSVVQDEGKTLKKNLCKWKCF